jgi:restriction system protein
MLPLLKLVGDNHSHSTKETIEALAHHFKLTDEEFEEMLPSGMLKFQRRVHQSKYHLLKSGLLRSSERGIFEISPKGIQLLKRLPQRITHEFLLELDSSGGPSLAEKQQAITESRMVLSQTDGHTPEEAIQSGNAQMYKAFAQTLLERIKLGTLDSFERLIEDLIFKLGYGGSRREIGKAIGKSGEREIGGVIKDDRLGFERIYVEAKWWHYLVTRSDAQVFASRFDGQQADKGLLITTSSFRNNARDYIEQLETKIVLIHGSELAQLLIEHDVGVTTSGVTDPVKKIDTKYFEEE